MNRAIIGLIFFLGIAIPFRSAGQGTDSASMLDMYVIKSTRLPSETEVPGQPVVVMTAKDIAMLPVNTLDELLRYIPGLDMRQRGPFGAQSDIRARGATFNQNLVVINGIPANDPLTGHFNANFMVSPGEIERIEVVRGPSSLEYGASSIGVTIHIYTYGFDRGYKADTAESFEHKARLSFGQYKLTEMTYATNYIHKRFYVGGSIWNHNQVGPARSDSTSRYMRREQYSVNAGFRFNSKWRIATRWYLGNLGFDARNFYTPLSIDRSKENLDRWRSEEVLFYEGGKRYSMDIRHSYSVTKDRFEFIPTAVNRHTSRLQFLQWNNRFKWDRWDMVLGLQAQDGVLRSNDRGNRSSFYTDVFGIGRYRQSIKTQYTFGVRVRRSNQNQVNVIPQAWFTHYEGKWKFRGGVGYATRTPDYTERFVSTGLTSLSNGRNLGNPNLSEEKTISLETGVDWQPRKFLFGATVWFRAAQNLIDYTLTPGSQITTYEYVVDTFSYMYATNLGSMNMWGTEFTISTRGENKLRHLKWEATLGHSLNFVLNSQDFQESKYVTNLSRNLINFSGAGSWKWFRFSSTLLYRERKQILDASGFIPPSRQYVVWNPGFGLVVPGGYIELSARNILNKHFSDVGGLTQPGRWWILAIKVNL